MKHILEGFILSLGFFTQIHIPYTVKEVSQKTYTYLILALPFIGLILAFIMLLFYHVASSLAHEVYVAILASILYLFLYGFLHLEAVSDIIDAYYAKHAGKDVETVLKDPTIGALGAIGTFSLVLIKVAALSLLLMDGEYIAVAAVLYLSRLMATSSIYAFTFHAKSQFILDLKNALNDKSMIILTLLSIMILIALGEILLLPISILLTFILQRWLRKNIGFLNGDGLGFIIEINELILLNVLIFS